MDGNAHSIHIAVRSNSQKNNDSPILFNVKNAQIVACTDGTDPGIDQKRVG